MPLKMPEDVEFRITLYWVVMMGWGGGEGCQRLHMITTEILHNKHLKSTEVEAY